MTYLHDYHVIWYDPQVHNASNKQHHALLQEWFADAHFLDDHTQLENTINSVHLPVVIISCGSRYTEIQMIVERLTAVIGVLIFCMNKEKYEQYKKTSKKFLEIITLFGEIAQSLKQMHKSYKRYTRFFSNRTEKTFYTLDDQKTIVESLQTSMQKRYFTIFYPLGMQAINVRNYLTLENLNEIEAVAKDEPNLPCSLSSIQSALAYPSSSFFFLYLSSLLLISFATSMARLRSSSINRDATGIQENHNALQDQGQCE